MPVKRQPVAPVKYSTAAPAAGRAAGARPPAARTRRSSAWSWLVVLALFLLTIVGGILAGGVFYLLARGHVLPGVTSMGVPLGGKTPEQAAAALQPVWDARAVTLVNGDATWTLPPADLGMTLDAPATAAAAVSRGRSLDSLRALPSGGAAWFEVPPVWRYDPDVAQRTLTDLAPQLSVAPQNATVSISNGQAVAVPAVDGRALDLAATLSAIQADPAGVLGDGRLDLVVRPVPAAVQDVSAAVAEANRLLSTTVTLEGYDPVRDEQVTWSVEPRVWSEWLRLTIDPEGAVAPQWTLDQAIAADFLDDLEAGLSDGRTLDDAATVAALSEAIQTQQPVARARIFHPARQHVVQSGETLSSIGYDYGIPYPWIQQANPGVDQLSVGQAITIPSPDVMLPLPPVPGKRIVVNMSEQRVRVYDSGQLRWDWPASTGIDSSPTAPGIFQVQSHEPNAYAGNWDLWMPSFMGIYRPVPTSDFMNGFHGFPTRGNAQLLWTGDLGRRVTYGCILLSSDNAAQLYDWAQDGVVVEVQR